MSASTLHLQVVYHLFGTLGHDHFYCILRSSVSVPLELEDSAADVHCDWDRLYLSRARRSPVSTSIWICPLPAAAPGIHTLFFRTPFGQFNGQQVDVICLDMPRIFSASLQPVSLDGTHQLIFKGSHLYSTQPLRFLCAIDSERIEASVVATSPGEREHLLATLPPIVPSVYLVSVYVEDLLVFKTSVCFSKNNLDKGFSFDANDDSSCEEDSPDNVFSARTISSLTQLIHPQVGLTNGNTMVVITAEGFLSSDTYSCHFGGKGVPGVLIDVNKILCYSPPHPPGRVDFYISNTKEDTWCCSDFHFYPILRALSLAPEMIDSRGSSTVTLNIQHVPSTHLFCYFHKIFRVPAIKTSSRSISCLSPDWITNENSATVAVGESYRAPIYGWKEASIIWQHCLSSYSFLSFLSWV